jgi:hypothetical protein
MKSPFPILGILVILLLAFFPVFQGKIPVNGRNLVSFYSPWYFEKFPGFPAGVPSKQGMLDQVRQFYPYMAFTQKTLREGQIPLWNPHNFAGNPHAAEWQSSIFYPLQMLLAVLPLNVWWTAYQAVGFFLAGIFTYAYLRNLKLSAIPAFFGAATFMLSGFMSGWSMGVFVAPHTIIWLPLILLSIDKIINSSPIIRHSSSIKQWWLIGLLSLVFSILAGFWQTTFYVMVVAFIYIIYRSLKIPKLTLLILVWFPLSLFLVGFYLFPAIELFQRSSRLIVNSSVNYQQYLLGYLLPVRHLMTLLAPDYFGHPTTGNYFGGINGSYYEQVIYVGIIPLTMALFSLFVRSRHRSLIKFWLFLILFSFALAFDNFLARLVYILRAPVISTSIPNRILFVSTFGLSVLAAFGIESLKKVNRKPLSLIFRLMAIALVVIALQTAIWKNKFFITSLRNLVLPMGIFVIPWVALEIGRYNLKKSGAVIFILIILSSFQALYQHHKFTAFSEQEFIFPRHLTIDWLSKNAGYYRFTGYNGKYLEDNFSTYFGLYSIEGYDALNDFRRSQLIFSSATGKLSPSFMTSSDAVLDRNLVNSNTLKLMSLMGIRYLVDRPEWIDVGATGGLPRLPDDKQKLVWQDGDWKIWEYLDAYPRAFLVGNYEVVHDGQETIDRLYSDDFNSRETVLLSQPLSGGLDISADETGSVSVEKYTPTKIVFKTKSKTAQLLFLSDTYYPGWWSRIDDGQKQAVLMADYALRAVAVPKGEYTVTMWYFPDSFKNGLILSLITVITVIIFIPQSGILLRRIKT